jgi:peptidyl-prolyl cis-trans isomerase A (cyclophilin A)
VAPHGADRFYTLVRAGFYDDTRIFRIRAGLWAQHLIREFPKLDRIERATILP